MAGQTRTEALQQSMEDSKYETNASFVFPQPDDLTKRYQYVLNDEVQATLFRQDDDNDCIDFKPGMLVWVLKSKGRFGGSEGEKKELFLRARVVSIDGTSHQNKACNKSSERRILVRYPKGSTYHVRESNLIPVIERNLVSEQKNFVLIAPETPEYRRASVVHTCVGESFLEIGSSFGDCVDRVRRVLTEVKDVPIHELPSDETNDTYVSHPNNNSNENVDARVFCLGIDKSAESIQIAKERFPETIFSLEDALSDEGTAKIRKLCHETLINMCPSVVAIDINGSREISAVLECLEKVMKAGSDVVLGENWELPRIIVVKSRYLYHHIKLQTKT